MRILSAILGLLALTALSCTQPQTRAAEPEPWTVTMMEIPLYHSSTVDPNSGFVAHVEYCGAMLTRGIETIHIVYRPADYSGRSPGFAKGDTVTVAGIERASDFGAMKGADYWIHDVQIRKTER